MTETVRRVRVGSYELLDHLGRGGMGDVWRARHVELERIAAVKLLKAPDPESLARFKREARVVARLNHPNIAQLFEVGDEGDKPYIAMQFIAGAPLDRAPLTLKGKLSALRDAARAVHYAHQQGILHRDLKPANIMVDAEGRGVVLDFGLAREVERGESSLSNTGDIFGTPAYMSPEQAAGDMEALDAHTDVWGLGATLYALAAGRPPFAGKTVYELVRKVLDEEPARPDGDADLATICLKSMEKDPSRRYASAAEFADELDRFMAGEPIQARPASLMYRWRKRVRRQPVLWGLAAALTISVAAGLTNWIHTLMVERDRLNAVALQAQRRADAEQHYHVATRLLRSLQDMSYRADATGAARDARSRQVEAAADAALRIDPDFAEAHFTRGQARLARMHTDEAAFAGAESDFTRTLQLHPTHTPALFQRGRLYLHRFVDLVMWDNIVHQNPLKSVVDHAEWKDRALDDFTRAQQLGGESEELLGIEVVLALANLRFRDVVEKGEAAIPKLAQANEVRIMVAAAQMFLDHDEEAAQQLDRVLSVWPHDRYALLLRTYLLLYNREYDAALKDVATLLEDDPNNLLAMMGKGELLRRQGHTEEARALLEQVVTLRPDNAAVWETLGDMRTKDGDPAGATEAYGRAIAASPGVAVHYSKRADAWRRLKEPAKAELDYTAAIERAARPSAELFHQRGVARLALEKEAEALADFDEAIRRDEKLAGPYLHRGRVAQKHKQWAEAEADLSRYIALKPGDADGYHHRGEVRLGAGNADGAVQDFQRALELEPSDHLKEQLEKARKRQSG